MLFRIRRYRLFLVFAAVVTVLTIRFAHSKSSLYHLSQSIYEDAEAPPAPVKENSPLLVAPPVKTAPPVVQSKKAKNPVADGGIAHVSLTTKSTETSVKVTDVLLPTEIPSIPQKTAVLPTIPQIVLPDREPIPPTKVYEDDGPDEIHPVSPPGRLDQAWPSAASTTIHWEKQVENWPIPTADLIKLPGGKTLKIPKIQHVFEDETSDAKISREKRQTKVRDEFKRAWNGYKQKAWLHDELTPVSGKFRDPFCGWAATLVDTLDTLWIMGLEEEFEEAARAVDQIDFTTSLRADIPMFETTIRYLGGLLAAYDVSGAKYKNLLTKAIELAEVLMGAFDTPNRMPQLYYRWRPAFASQPHRASQRSNLAELGSLTMEFTRLSQLTKNPKYYDAIARVTNALAEWQLERGTQLDGVFPDNVDASGCNRTDLNPAQPIATKDVSIITPSQAEEAPVGYRPVSPDTVAEPIPKKGKDRGPSGPGTLEVQVIGGEAGPGKAQIVGWNDEAKKEGLKAKRQFEGDAPASGNISSRATPTTNEDAGLPLDIPAAKKMVGEFVGDWDCHPQNLTSASPWGNDKFSMGGGQDSTYEYFPKQYLLLGGLDDTYRKMYLRTIDAVRKHMIYRPMLPDNRDILFSGSVSFWGGGDPKPQLSADVEHLTCFVGGMVGLGAKIFGLDGDMELAKKLSDGCVWAYESTASGIMPEGGTVMPCAKVDDCKWNETAYWQFLDPSWADREQMVIDYETNKAKKIQQQAEAKVAAQRIAAEVAQQKADEKTKDPSVSDFVQDGYGSGTTADPLASNFMTGGVDGRKAKDPSVSDFLGDKSDGSLAHDTTDPTKGSAALKKDQPVSLQKRQLGDVDNQKEIPKPITHDFRDDLPSQNLKQKQSQNSEVPHVGTQKETPKAITHDFRDDVAGQTPTQGRVQIPTDKDPSYTEREKAAEHNLADFAQTGRTPEKPLSPHNNQDLPPDPNRPKNHTQFVLDRIAQDQLPPGYVTISSKKYILRPEAIESVWYMYRITGDKIWQDKGWKMFESIIKATSTKYGHTAVYDVLTAEPYAADEMESFWLAETLKYFYLLYSTPDTISLDDWVLNTEAHPFKRPV